MDFNKNANNTQEALSSVVIDVLIKKKPADYIHWQFMRVQINSADKVFTMMIIIPDG